MQFSQPLCLCECAAQLASTTVQRDTLTFLYVTRNCALELLLVSLEIVYNSVYPLLKATLLRYSEAANSPTY